MKSLYKMPRKYYVTFLISFSKSVTYKDSRKRRLLIDRKDGRDISNLNQEELGHHVSRSIRLGPLFQFFVNLRVFLYKLFFKKI